MCVWACVHAHTRLGLVLHFHSETSTGDCPGAVTMATRGEEQKWRPKGRERVVTWCLCVCARSCLLLISCFHYEPSSRLKPRDPTVLAQAHVHPGWPRCACFGKCCETARVRDKKIWLRQTVTLRLTQCIIRQSISRLSGQLINETIPFGWPPLSLACASKLLPRSPGYDRAAVADSPIEPPG